MDALFSKNPEMKEQYEKMLVKENENVGEDDEIDEETEAFLTMNNFFKDKKWSKR